MIEKAKTYALIVLVCIAIGAMLWGWYKPAPLAVQPQKEYVVAPEQKIVEKIKKVLVPGPERIVTIEKKVVSEKLDLPDSIKNDDSKQVIANAEIQPYKGKTSVVTILDTKTGEGQTITKQLAPPLFAFENTKEIGIRYGLSTKADRPREGVLYGRWTFFRVGNFKLAGYGEINTSSEAKALIDTRYEW